MAPPTGRGARTGGRGGPPPRRPPPERPRLARLAGGSTPDVSSDIADALAEIAANFPVYRSYLPEGAEHLTAALTATRRGRPELSATVDALAHRLADPAEELA